MILTYKLKHHRDFSQELKLAHKVAVYAVANKSYSSKDVKHFGLKSAISCQIIRKYARNKTLKTVKNVNLIVPNQKIEVKPNSLYISCLKLLLETTHLPQFMKVNQIELDDTYAYISLTVQEMPKCSLVPQMQIIGVDRNTCKHVLVASNLNTGKVLKLGKECNHIHTKYKCIRRKLQKAGKFKLLKKIKHREHNIVKNINHQISSKLVDEASYRNAIIVLEELKNIRQTARVRKGQRYSLNSWSFNQLGEMITYKAKKFGIPIVYVKPQYTSQRCSRCGYIDSKNRKAKLFHCGKCGIVENADVNAGFNIGHLYRNNISQFAIERDIAKGSTDTPKDAILRNLETSNQIIGTPAL